MTGQVEKPDDVLLAPGEDLRRLRDWATVYESAIPSDVTWHVNDALFPRLSYNVSVRAETGGGLGAPALVGVATWDTLHGTRARRVFPPQRNPSPVQRLVLPTLPCRSWRPPASPSRGSQTCPRLKCQAASSTSTTRRRVSDRIGRSQIKLGTTASFPESNSWQQSESVYLPSKRTVVGNLEPGVVYLFAVVSKDGNRSTQSDTKSIALRADMSVIYQPLVETVPSNELFLRYTSYYCANFQTLQYLQCNVTTSHLTPITFWYRGVSG